MTDQSSTREGAPFGSVAEEAARLVDAFAAWSTAQRAAGPAGEARDEPYAGRPGAAGAEDAADDWSPERPARGSADEEAGEGPGCEACGARTGVGRAESCGICPVCQGITWLRAVRPETLDRLADVAAVLTDALREVARQGRRGAGRPGDEMPDTAPGRGASVQHIPVEDDDIEKRTTQ